MKGEPHGLVVRRCPYGSRSPEFESCLTEGKDHRSGWEREPILINCSLPCIVSTLEGKPATLGLEHATQKKSCLCMNFLHKYQGFANNLII